MEHWLKDIDAGKMVGVLLIDLSKAFDSVFHQRLISDLIDIGCSDITTKWFISYLSNRFQRLVNISDSSSWKAVNIGVPQGSCLSPLLFNIFVRNLPKSNNLLTIQYADDVTESFSDFSLSSIINNLESGFIQIKDYCHSRGLTINTLKTQSIIFKIPSKKLPDDLSILLDGCSIKVNKSVKLLGVTLDQHLSFKDHIQNVSRKCRGYVGVLARASPFMSKDLLRLAYISLIRSQLEFSCAIFSSASVTQLQKLDIIQKMSSRVVCSAPRDAHAAPLLQALKLENLGDRRKAHIEKIIKSILSNSCHPALCNLFTQLNDGRIVNDEKFRIKFSARRFSIFVRNLFNAQ